MRRLTKTSIAILITALFASGLATLAEAQDAALANENKRLKTPRERIAERNLPNVTLTTHKGKKVKFYDDLIKDKIVILNFMYSKCDGKCHGERSRDTWSRRLGRDQHQGLALLRHEPGLLD